MVKFVVNGREAYSEQPGDTPLNLPLDRLRSPC